MREKINLTDKPTDVIFKLSEGNPGAVNVLMQLFQDGPTGFLNILCLDDMNMRGPQIWVAFKDFAGEDLETLKEGLKSRSQDMVDKVNEECGADGEFAVTSGASYGR